MQPFNFLGEKLATYSLKREQKKIDAEEARQAQQEAAQQPRATVALRPSELRAMIRDEITAALPAAAPEQSPMQANTVEADSIPENVSTSDSMMVGGRFKAFLRWVGAYVLPAFIIYALAAGNGYVFAGLRPFGTDTWLAYVGGIAVELGGIVLLFSAAEALHYKRKQRFLWFLAGAIPLQAISFVTQVVYLWQTELKNGLSIPEQAVSNLPFIGGLAQALGMNGQEVVLSGRAAAYVIINVAATFGMTKAVRSIDSYLEERKTRLKAKRELTWETSMMDMRGMMDGLLATAIVDTQKTLKQRLETASQPVQVQPAQPAIDPTLLPALLAELQALRAQVRPAENLTAPASPAVVAPAVANPQLLAPYQPEADASQNHSGNGYHQEQRAQN